MNPEVITPDAPETQSIPEPGAAIHQMTEERTPLPVLNGIIGALLGSLPGVLLWIILGQFGYIAGIAGWLMIIGARFGYQKLAGGINKLGSVLSLIIALIMPAVSEYIGLAVSVYREFHADYGVTVGDAFRSIPYFLSEPDVVRPLAGSLAIGYFLMLLVFFTSLGRVRQPKQKNQKMPDLTHM